MLVFGTEICFIARDAVHAIPGASCEAIADAALFCKCLTERRATLLFRRRAGVWRGAWSDQVSDPKCVGRYRRVNVCRLLVFSLSKGTYWYALLSDIDLFLATIRIMLPSNFYFLSEGETRARTAVRSLTLPQSPLSRTPSSSWKTTSLTP